MKTLVEETVFALADATLAQQLGHPPDEEILASVGGTLLSKLRGMPTFLGSGMLGVTCLVSLSTLPSHGRLFHQLPLQARQRRLNRLKSAPVNVLRDFASFYEKMGIFAYYCREEARSQADAPREMSR